MILAKLVQRRDLDPAAVEDKRAARGERAAGQRAGVGWDGAGDGSHALAAAARVGDGIHQPTGVGMVGLVEDIAGGAAFSHPPGIQDSQPVAGLGDHTQVVGDQDDRDMEGLLQVAQQSEDLRLDGHVQGGGRLVGDQQAGVAGKRHGDHHALLHAAGELVRIGTQDALDVGQTDRRRAPAGLFRRLAVSSAAGAGG